MNAYKELKDRQQREQNNFPMVFAFGKEQFEEAMKKLGLDPSETDKVCSIYGIGDILLRSDVPAYLEMVKRHHLEMDREIEADDTGDGFVFDMFDYELSNHEYAYTMNPTSALDALGISEEKLMNNPKLMYGFTKACRSQMDWYDAMMEEGA